MKNIDAMDEITRSFLLSAKAAYSHKVLAKIKEQMDAFDNARIAAVRMHIDGLIDCSSMERISALYDAKIKQLLPELTLISNVAHRFERKDLEHNRLLRDGKSFSAYDIAKASDIIDSYLR